MTIGPWSWVLSQQLDPPAVHRVADGGPKLTFAVVRAGSGSYHRRLVLRSIEELGKNPGGVAVGPFSKVVLDVDFEKAMQDDAPKFHRKVVQEAQGRIRSNLISDEQLMFLFCEDFVFRHLLVFTNRRLLIFDLTDKFNTTIDKLVYDCQPQDILGASVARSSSSSIVTLRLTAGSLSFKSHFLQTAELIANLAAILHDDRRL